jgi:hypothetical protein
LPSLQFLAVEVLEPGLERGGGRPIEPAQERGLPVVPGGGADAADVADRQDRQKLQPFPRLHRLGEVAHRAGVGDVAFLRHVGHEQVVAHEPFHGLALGRLQAETGADRPRDAGADDRMILLPALADVVQEAGHVEHLAVHAVLEDAGGDGQFLDQFLALDLGEGRDHLDRVLVHRVAVIHVELHHRDDGGEFGQEGGEHAKLVHPPERAFGIAVLEQQVEEDAHRLGVAAHRVVDHVKPRLHAAHGVGVDAGSRS